ncbi:hypothetical protein JCM3765_002022 [Sporobolomyces pararoseus]
MSTQQPHSSSTFKRLVRALSRPDLRSESKKASNPASDAILSSSYDWGDEKYAEVIPPVPSAQKAAPHSYFPSPPEEIWLDGEANGTERHVESVGAKASEAGGSIAAAPGVPFAPRGLNDQKPVRPDSELESWNLPRKPSRPSLRRSRSSKSSQKSKSKSPPGSNDGHESISDWQGSMAKGGYPTRRPDSVSIYSTKSNKSSLGRAANTLKKAISRTFEPLEREDGEKRVMILVADGTDELSLMTAHNIFARASLSPVLVSVSPEFSPSHSLPHLTLSQGAKILADTKLEKLREPDFDAVVIPGGEKGAERLSKDEGVKKLLADYFDGGKLIGCIGEGSIVAQSAQVGFGLEITSHPSVRHELEKTYDFVEDRIVVSENLVTSRTTASAMDWALKIVEILSGYEKRDEVALELGL